MEYKRHFTREAYFEEEQYRYTGVTVTLGENDEDEVKLEIKYQTDKKQGFEGWKTISDYNLNVTFPDISQVQLMAEVISEWLDTDSETRLRKDLGVVSGIFEDRLHHTFEPNGDDFKSSVDSLESVVREDGIELICRESGEYVDSVYIPGSSEERDNEDLNIANIESFHDQLHDFISYEKSDASAEELSPLIDGETEAKLTSSKYGQEIITHIREGDQCYRSDLYNPALSSYIHAIEWAIISYLESDENVDIIQREQNGQLYYFARGQNNLLDEITNKANIDQKTVSRLQSMNRAERRWMAHHKKGSTLPEDVMAVRARLGELLQTLYP